MSGSNRDTWRPTLQGAVQMAPEGPPPKITAEEFCGKGRRAAMLPTPSASSYGTNQGGEMGRVGPVRPSLETMARQGFWPTPKGSAANYGRPRDNDQGDLQAAVLVWRTPKASDAPHSGRAMPAKPGQTTSLDMQVNALEETIGQLNPTWVEWLMGFPPGWTDLGA